MAILEYAVSEKAKNIRCFNLQKESSMGTLSLSGFAGAYITNTV